MARPTAATSRATITARPLPTGFTLVESLLACTVLALGVVSVGGLLAASHQHDRFIREELAAAGLCRSGIEEASSAPFAATVGPVIADFSGLSVQLDAQGHPLDPAALPGDRYARAVNVSFPATLLGARGDGNLAIVTSTVVAPCGRTVTLRRLVVRDTLSGG